MMLSISSPAPNDKMKEVLMKTVEEARAMISKVRASLKATFCDRY